MKTDSIRNFFIPILLLLSAIILFGCGETDNRITLKIGEQAPSLTIKTLTGDTFSLPANIKNEENSPLVLFFIASWCPCTKDSIPIIKSAYELYNPKGIEFLAIGIQDNEKKFRAFVKEANLPFSAAFDSGNAMANAYGIKAPPSIVLIDKSGNVQRAHYGNIKDLEAEFIEVWLRELL
jgi:peroxiredoxin